MKKGIKTFTRKLKRVTSRKRFAYKEFERVSEPFPGKAAVQVKDHAFAGLERD